MSDRKKKSIFGYLFKKNTVPEIKIEQTERPTIDVGDYSKNPGIALNTPSGAGSYFKADPGFKKQIVSYIDVDGLIRYKYR